MRSFPSFTVLPALTVCAVAATLDDARSVEECRRDVARIVLAYDDRGRPLVPVTIEGRRERMLLDTGGSLTALEMDIVTELNLPQAYAGFTLTAATGESSWLYTVVGAFSLAGLDRAQIPLMILPGYEYILTDDEPVGILALDFLDGYEVRIDFVEDALEIALPSDCSVPSNEFYEITADGQLHLGAPPELVTVPVLLDGVELEALIDTGAAQSVLNLDVATAEFGIDIGMPDERMAPIDAGDGIRIYERRFERLEFAGVAVDQPTLQLFPNVIGRSGRTAPDGSPLTLSSVILGMDVLSELRIEVSAGGGDARISRSDPP